MKQFRLAIFFLFLTTLTYASTPHTHGEATASMIIENNKVTIALSIPSESVVGFEHSPTTDDEVQQIQTATKKLQSSSLFEFYKLSGFFKNKTNIQPVERSIAISSPQKEKATIFSIFSYTTDGNSWINIFNSSILL